MCFFCMDCIVLESNRSTGKGGYLMSYIPDNNDLFERHDAEREAKLNRLPKCSCCGHPIQDEYCYQIDGKTICESCMESDYRVSTEDLM